MKPLILFLFSCFAALCADAQSLDLTIKDYGLSIGDSRHVNGIRVNFRDQRMRRVNGLNFTLWEPIKPVAGEVRGFAVGLPTTGAREINGIGLGLFGVSSERSIRGIVVGGLGAGSGEDVVGISVGGLGVGSGRDIKGVMIGGLGAGSGRNLVGLAVGGLGVGSGGDVRGVLIAGLGAGGGGDASAKMAGSRAFQQAPSTTFAASSTA